MRNKRSIEFLLFVGSAWKVHEVIVGLVLD